MKLVTLLFLCLCIWPGCLCVYLGGPLLGWDVWCGSWEYWNDCNHRFSSAAAVYFYDDRVDAHVATKCCQADCWHYTGRTCSYRNFFGVCTDYDYNIDHQITSVPAGQYRTSVRNYNLYDVFSYWKCSLANCPGCPAGQYRSACGGPQSLQVIGPGYCTDCSSGQYKTSTGSEACSNCASQNCGTGMYLSECGGNSAGSCATCPSCLANQYRSGCGGSNAGSCKNCETSCDPGKFLSGCSGTNAGGCINCPAGTYKTTTGTSQGGCLTCPTNPQCPAGTQAGTSPAGSTTVNDCCSDCPAGKYKFNAGTAACQTCAGCSAGHVRYGCGGSSAGECHPCHYCNAGTEVIGCSTCTPRNELVHGYSCGQCQTCASDEYRVVWGLSDPLKCQSCSSFASACATNHFLLGCGTSQTIDDNGYYQSSKGNCRNCDESAFTCPSANQYRVNCGGTSKGTCTACPSCPSGQYRSGCQATSSGSCVACGGCGGGYYRTGCTGTSAGECTPCAAGTYKESTGSEACTSCSQAPNCPAGEYRYACGHTTGMNYAGSCNNCPNHDYSYAGAVDSCTDCGTCASGKYRQGCGMARQLSTGEWHTKFDSPGTCEYCAQGTYKTSWGTQPYCDVCMCNRGFQITACGRSSGVTCGVCPAGKYQPLDGTTQPCTDCQSCPKGQYLSGCLGSNGPGTCLGCAAGTYKDTVGTQPCSACSFCAEGKFLTGCGGEFGPGTCENCAAGTYKTGGGSEPCSSCTECRAIGKENLCFKSLYEPAGECVASSGTCQCDDDGNPYCLHGDPLGSDVVGCSCTPAPPGNTVDGGINADTQLTVTGCNDCPSGKYKDTEGTHVCQNCGCGAGTEISNNSCTASTPPTCVACTAGKFKTTTGSEACSPCQPCPAGYERLSCGGASPGACTGCAAGKYSVTNDLQPCQDCCDSSLGRFVEIEHQSYDPITIRGSCLPDKEPVCAKCTGLVTWLQIRPYCCSANVATALRHDRTQNNGQIVSGSSWNYLGDCDECIPVSYDIFDRGLRRGYYQSYTHFIQNHIPQVARYLYSMFQLFDDKWFSTFAYDNFVDRSFSESLGAPDTVSRFDERMAPFLSYEKNGKCEKCTQCTPPLYVNNCGGNGVGPGECQSCSVGKTVRKNVAEIQRCLQTLVYYDWPDANYNVFDYTLFHASSYTIYYGMFSYSQASAHIYLNDDSGSPFQTYTSVEDCWCTACGPCDPGFERTGCDGTGSDGSCTPCADGYYRTTTSTDSCQLCSSDFGDCPAGEYPTQTCGGANGQVCSPCPLGYFKPNAGMHDCTLCSPCADGYYESAPCTRTTNRVCVPCLGCADNEFILRSCSDYHPTVCQEKSCRQCQSGSSLVPGSCTGTNNGQCECIAGYYEVGIVNTTFTECVPCPANSFKLEAGNHNCTWCDECGTGIDYTACQKQCECYDASVCNWCPSNQYKPTLGHQECRNCKICGSNEYEVSPCTLYSDRQCAPCSTCAADEIESFVCSAYFDTGCFDYHLFCRRCGVGELLQGCTIDSPGECYCLPGYTSNAQGVCTACPDTWYKTTVGDDPCLPCSFCVDDDNKHCESMCTCTVSTDFNPSTCPNDCQNAISLDTCPDNQAYDDSYTCVCTVGYELKDGTCSPCPSGYVKYTVGNTACVEMEGCDMADSIECDMREPVTCYTY